MVKKQLHSISGWGEPGSIREREKNDGGCREEGVVSIFLPRVDQLV